MLFDVYEIDPETKKFPGKLVVSGLTLFQAHEFIEQSSNKNYYIKRQIPKPICSTCQGSGCK